MKTNIIRLIILILTLFFMVLVFTLVKHKKVNQIKENQTNQQREEILESYENNFELNQEIISDHKIILNEKGFLVHSSICKECIKDSIRENHVPWNDVEKVNYNVGVEY